jgi:hypothetical protein
LLARTTSPQLSEILAFYAVSDEQPPPRESTPEEDEAGLRAVFGRPK